MPAQEGQGALKAHGLSSGRALLWLTAPTPQRSPGITVRKHVMYVLKVALSLPLSLSLPLLCRQPGEGRVFNRTHSTASCLHWPEPSHTRARNSRRSREGLCTQPIQRPQPGQKDGKRTRHPNLEPTSPAQRQLREDKGQGSTGQRVPHRALGPGPLLLPPPGEPLPLPAGGTHLSLPGLCKSTGERLEGREGQQGSGCRE